MFTSSSASSPPAHRTAHIAQVITNPHLDTCRHTHMHANTHNTRDMVHTLAWCSGGGCRVQGAGSWMRWAAGLHMGLNGPHMHICDRGLRLCSTPCPSSPPTHTFSNLTSHHAQCLHRTLQHRFLAGQLLGLVPVCTHTHAHMHTPMLAHMHTRISPCASWHSSPHGAHTRPEPIHVTCRRKHLQREATPSSTSSGLKTYIPSVCYR